MIVGFTWYFEPTLGGFWDSMYVMYIRRPRLGLGIWEREERGRGVKVRGRVCD